MTDRRRDEGKEEQTEVRLGDGSWSIVESMLMERSGKGYVILTVCWDILALLAKILVKWEDENWPIIEQDPQSYNWRS